MDRTHIYICKIDRHINTAVFYPFYIWPTNLIEDLGVKFLH